MWSSKRTIAAGDTVIVWMTRDSLEPLVVTPNAVLHNKWGQYPHNAFIGLPYGSKVRSSAPSNSGRGGPTGGFLYILRPTPELWTLALPHRTQILYIADISFVVNWLNIGPGKRVVEAGTGSGSFSHSVARTVGREGRLFTFEFHEQRAMKAKAEFEKHGLSPGLVTLQHRNVCKDGFGEGIEDSIDAVFLDLPAPWEAIPHAKKVLRKDGVARICCFSPCIEQVIRTVTALNDAGFSGTHTLPPTSRVHSNPTSRFLSQHPPLPSLTEITMFETLQRPIEVSSTPKLASIEDAADRLKAAEIKREEKRLRQIAQNREKEALDKALAEGGGSGGSGAGKRKQSEGDEDGEAGEGANGDGDVKRAKTQSSTTPEEGEGEKEEEGLPRVPVLTTREIKLPVPARSKSGKYDMEGKIAVSKALPEVRGHTSYLTFACLVPYAYALAQGEKKGTGAVVEVKEVVNGATPSTESKGEGEAEKSAEPEVKDGDA
ncbi:tRNA methyltransferase complex GCD14 subunit [Ephemerocybe angulata]|uniref:tRNA (adenine(58)-N(1))-methyltransferase catalytic subunit TRM61 n=1 Tax=Ephemerocybe angulata TaxID=980116 RepID=A0A8H6HLC5_9AGAR|nr:tRNA methyltransferase complex GCD14 subunit [Tulosesus angulatus]